jgi:hypothetical protein
MAAWRLAMVASSIHACGRSAVPSAAGVCDSPGSPPAERAAEADRGAGRRVAEKLPAIDAVVAHAWGPLGGRA